MYVVLAVLILTTAWYMITQYLTDPSRRDSKNDAAWERAVQNEKSQVGRILLKVSRPVANIPQIYEAGTSPQYKALHAKVMSSGAFAGNLEVFLATQATAAFVGFGILMVTVVSGAGGSLLFAGLLGGLGIAALPYNVVSKKAAARERAVAEELPDFAELLLMPLESGMTPMAALAFTAERLNGPVAQEVRNLRTVINSRSMTEAQAFQLAASRLGTPEANAFFTALMQAHLEGAKVIRNLQSQAEALRVTAHQRKREEMKKLPVKLVIIFAMHLLPVLFVAALLPTFFALTRI